MVKVSKLRPNPRAVGIRYGRMLAALDAASVMLHNEAYQASELLESSDRDILKLVLDQLRGLSQRAWSKA